MTQDPGLTAAKAQLGSLAGAVVAEADDAATMRKAKAQGLPCLGLDGTVTKVATGQFDGKATINARVELLVRHHRIDQAHVTGLGR